MYIYIHKYNVYRERERFLVVMYIDFLYEQSFEKLLIGVFSTS